MKAKKVICIILTFILAFTLLSGPWRAEVEAAGPAIAVAVVAIVGFFIVTSGYTFDSQADFRTATDAFMESEAAQYVTKIHEIVTEVSSAGLSLSNFNLAQIITQPWFLEFWAAIQDFFGGGEVPGATLTAPDGYAYYNGVLLPDLPTEEEYSYLNDRVLIGGSYATGWADPIMVRGSSNSVYLYYFAKDYGAYRFFWCDDTSVYGLTQWSGYLLRCSRSASVRFSCKIGDTTADWTERNLYSSSEESVASLFINSAPEGSTAWSIVWAPQDVKYMPQGSSTYELYLAGSEPSITLEGDVIGVYEDDNIIPPSDVIGGFDAGAIDGSIDWALDSSSVYQDLTAAGDVPLTATQTGALTEAGVEVQTAVKVETMEQYRAPGLTTIFPFCIPFDIYRFLNILTAEREAPHFEFNLNFGALGSHEIEVDLSEWETVAAVLRTIELLAFCVGLAFATSKVIKW